MAADGNQNPDEIRARAFKTTTAEIVKHPKADEHKNRLAPAFTAADLSSMAFPPLQFIAEPILAPGATILAGKPKVNKSWLALEIAISVATGEAACGGAWRTRAGDALYFALEDNQRRLQSRMNALRPNGCAGLENLTFRTDAPLLGRGFSELVTDWARSSRNPRFVVIDTFAFIRPPRPNAHASYSGDYADAAAITKLANELGIAIVAIHHLRKAEADDPLDAISGTTGIAAGFDTILALTRSASGFLRLDGRGRDILPVEIALNLDPQTTRWKVEGDPATAGASDQRRAIIDYLAKAGEAGPKEISEASGVAHDVVRQLLGTMTGQGLIRKIGRGSYAPVHNVHNVHNGGGKPNE